MSEQATSDCTQMSEPTEAHKTLERFAGTFKAEVKMWMGPGEPHVSTGEMSNTMDLGGRFLHQRYTGDATDGPFPGFEGRGYWGFNTVKNMYEGFWIDTAAPFMQTETGSVDAGGNVWTMIGEMPNPTGGTFEKKSIITFIDADHHAMEMFFKTPDGQESKGMEIKYVRKR